MLWVYANVKKPWNLQSCIKGHTEWVGCTHQEVHGGLCGYY